MSEPNRKLAAILSADVAGYSRLMAADEAATVETLKEYRAAIGRVVARHKGAVVNAPGDNILAQFASAVEAVQAAVEIQKVLEGRNLELSPDRRMSFRIGVNLGDVIEEADGTIYGDGVNIAARMEALAEAGGICVSSSVYDAVAGKIDFGFDFLGAQQVKNIDRPINVYRVRSAPGAGAAKAAEPRAKGGRRRLPIAATAAVAVVVVAAGVYWALRPASETVQTAEAPEAAPAAAEDPILALPTGPSIAVLPFDNLSGDPEQDYFADGIAEDILTRLSRFTDLKVIGRTSSFKYKDAAEDVRDIGRALGARYVLEGSVRRSQDTVRVSVQLLDALNGTHMWANDFNRNMTVADVFAIQEDIAGSIAATIAGAYGVIVKAGRSTSRRKPTDSLEAYECVLQASYYDSVLTPAQHAVARDCLEHAVEIDPGYADAWAWLARLYTHEYAFGFNLRPDPLERSLTAASRAYELDPTNQWANWELAEARYFRHELDQFFSQAERAIALNPNNVSVIGEAAQYMAWAGVWERGVALSDKAIALSPLFPEWFHFTYFWDHYRKHEFEAALAEAQKINMPEFFWTHVVLAAAYGQLGRSAEAATAVAALNELNPGFASRVRDEMKKFNLAAPIIDLTKQGLRKAGLDMPEESAVTQ